MLAWLLAASLVSSDPPGARFHATASVATAAISVRILDAATISLGQLGPDQRAQLRDVTVRVDGRAEPARLVEFE
ncbi:MAG: hypothetical protein ABIQ98_03170 [Sphingomicrobium sp.]